ncbi:PRC-barrel domain protein [Methanobrevibacter cuticularis]|uniref:PRC-barrel domain protein n=1 Tax=Methanobrevibacter cuticularis TaxID=47311 RepID=A0A166CRN3_9EURY|nr:PRC-barrel domain-containing protein [Methanobrevibacter cuticularis]KZX14793.1 PRC-barrel domain protein [Methanobrevibacter cuticularis]
MEATKLLGLKVINSRGHVIGKVNNFEINQNTGFIERIAVKTHLLSTEDKIFTFNEIDNIVDVVLVTNEK